MTSLSRRALAKGIAGLIGAAVAAKSIIPRIVQQPELRRARPVVSFFLDQPYVDTSGLATPYHPPIGVRAGAALAELSELEFRHIAPYG